MSAAFTYVMHRTENQYLVVDAIRTRENVEESRCRLNVYIIMQGDSRNALTIITT